MAQSATPAAKTKNITSDKSPVCPVCQHFLSWGKYETVVQSAATPPMHTAEDMVGDWAIARGTGKPICVLTLVNDPPGGDTLALKVKPGCDAFVARFGPTGWRMNQGELVLLSARGQTWRFEQNDASTWQRVPEGANPVLLVRQ